MDRRKPFLKPAVLLCCSFFLIAFSCTAEAQTPPQIAGKAFESTVLLVMEDTNGQPVSIGSGFLVREGEIASNLHVIKEASRGYAKFIGRQEKYDIKGISGIDPDSDLVLLKISSVHTPPLSLSNSDAVQVGETVYAVGNPQGLEGTFSQGIISAIRQVGKEKALQITAPISPGSSGGPVLNTKGEVIGVSVATFRGGQNLNFAIPSNYLKTLIAKAGPSKSLSGAKPLAKKRSIFKDLGGPSTDGLVGANLTYDSSPFPNGDFSVTLVNKLHNAVKNAYCLIVFYDVQDTPLDVAIVHYEGVIPGGLGKRVNGKVEASVERLNNPTQGWGGTVPPAPRKPKGKIIFRTLDFQIAE